MCNEKTKGIEQGNCVCASGFNLQDMQDAAWQNLVDGIVEAQGFFNTDDMARRDGDPAALVRWVDELDADLPPEADVASLYYAAMDFAHLCTVTEAPVIVVDERHTLMWGALTEHRVEPFDQDKVTNCIYEGHYPMIRPIHTQAAQAGML